VDGFLEANDPRVVRLAEAENSPIGQVWVIGSYAVPLSVEELARDAGPEPSG
jgi:6,7-dimethyl-8-ribityllumazine synthase